MIFKQQDVKSLLGVNTDEIIQPFANAASVIDEYNQHVQNGTLTTENFNNILQSCDESLANYLKNILGEEGSLTGYEVSLNGSFDSLMKINSVIQEFNNLDPSKQEDFATAVGLTNVNLGNYLSGLNGANGSLIGYGISLATSTAKTIGLTLATTALNAA